MSSGYATVGLIAGLCLLAGCAARPAATPPSPRATSSGVNESGNGAVNGSGGLSEMVLVPQSVVHMLETHATLLGPHPGNAPIRLTVGMKLRNAAALKQFNADVSDPSSPAYRHYLTPAEFTARYGPSPEDVTAVTNWLKAQGIHVLDVSSNRLLIHTEAPTKTYEDVLGIRINDYRMNGRTFYSTTDRATLPRSIAARITSISGLNNGVLLHPLSHTGG